MPDPAPNLDTVVCEAVELPDPAARAAYLDRACGADAALRRRAAALVEAHFRPGVLDRPPADPADTAAYGPGTSDTDPAAGAVVGPYALRELIGEGGMGLVYVAEQTHPVRRKVAVKLIKPGMDSRQVVARFEQERQALALMDHPHIARVLDAGTTDRGRPYFVMELVRGSPITDHCDARRLTVRQRLELFLQVCGAVQHAHQKGVIHRDIKPSNVLVAVHDVAAVAKVIDFGIAKAVGQALTDKTVYTAVAQVVGTPLYMAPEQAGESSLDVDTRTDVYALGVLLYELLTGTTPIDPAAARTAGFDELRRKIREDEPARPSARLSTLKGAARSTVASTRSSDPRRLAGEVRGELDWVVMKCLEKDRNRRYDTVDALAADVRRYLADEPVTACPPSAGYRLRKFARRNRASLLTTGLVAAALVAGAAVSLWQAVAADRAAARADDSYRRARAAVRQLLARVATDEIDRSPEMREVRRRLLGDAAEFYTDLLAADPADTEARFERGRVFAALSRSDEACRDFEAVLALDPDHADAHLALGAALTHDRPVPDFRRAVAHLARAAELRPGDPEPFGTLIFARHYLHDRDGVRAAVRGYVERAPPGDWRAAVAAADGHRLVGEAGPAVAHARRAAALAPDEHAPHAALAHALAAAGEADAALAAADAAVRRITRANDPGVKPVFQLRGELHARAGRHAAAAADYSRAIEIGSRGHHGGWHFYKRRAAAYVHLGDYPRALADMAAAVDRNPGDPSNLIWAGPDRVAGCPDPGFRQGVLGLAARAVERSSGSPGPYSARAQLYEAMHQDAKAAADWAAAVAACRRKQAAAADGPAAERDRASRELADVQVALGHSLLRRGRPAEAEPVLRECLGVREALEADTWPRFHAMSLLGGAVLGQGRYAEAEPLLLQGYDGMKQRERAIRETGRRWLPEAAERVAQLYEATGRPEEAAEWRAKRPREAAPPPRPRP